MKRMLAFLTILAVTFCYVACGSPKGAASAAASYAPAAKEQMPMMQDAKSLDGETADTGSALAEQELPRDGRKIIYDCTLQMESTDFAATQAALNEAVKAANGYASSTSLENDSHEEAMRYATYTYRIPADGYAAFLTSLGKAGNVTSQQENTQDITAEYVDVEARLKSLKTQEEGLLKMLTEAGNLETMLAIQNQLTEVQYRIESYTAQQRTYDDLVQYCTVTVQVQEVKHATESKITFGDRAGAAFRESWRDFGEGCKSFAVAFIYFIPTLLVLAALGALSLVIARGINKRTQERRTAMAAHKPVTHSQQPTQCPQQSPTAGQQAPTYGAARPQESAEKPQK